MDEQNSKKDTPEKNESTRRLPDPTDGIKQAKEEGRARHRNGGQSKYYAWGLSWYEFLTLVVGSFVGLVAIIAAFMQWRADTTSTRQKERPRIVFSEMRRKPVPPLSFSLIFKNAGETTALNAYGVWLGGECQYASFQKCVEWCLRPLRETQGESYGSILSQEEHKEDFFSTLKTGTARKKQRPIYYCGYFAYTDVFCMWRRQFHSLSYDPATDQFSFHPLSNEEEEAQVQNCSP